MTNKFSMEMQSKFMKDLENISIEPGDSDLEDSTDDIYYQQQKKRMQEAISALKLKKNNTVLQQAQKLQQMQDNYIEQYQDDICQLQGIIKNQEKNVIEESMLQEIKKKVFNESRVQTVILADEIIVKDKQKKDKAVKQNQVKTEKQKSNDEADNKLQQKIENAKIQRQIVLMEREDEFSKKLEAQHLSQFFSQRFFEPKIMNPRQKRLKIKIISGTPCQTFSSLKPLANNQQNVLSKNSPQMALRRIKKSKKIKLVASSTSQSTVKIKKLNPQNPERNDENQEGLNQQSKNSQRTEQVLYKYLENLQKSYPEINRLSQWYKPKFINEFENQPEQNLIIDDDLENVSKGKSFGKCLQVEDAAHTKDISLAFENITDTKGIQNFYGVEQIALQYNLLKSIENIQSCSKIIQLNISHNKIRAITPLKKLQQMRILNIQHNAIDQICLEGGSLQFLYAGHNNIQQIVSINQNKYLKKLLVDHNKLHSLANINKLYYLEEINASKNYLQNLDGIQDCVMLRVLEASENRLEKLYSKLQNFIFVFLNKLVLRANSLSQINNIFLPSLQELYLDKNRIEKEGSGLIYFPELKILNLDQNKLTGFNCVYSLIKYSHNLQTIKYDKNTYFLEVRQKVRELYEHIIYDNMNKLVIINQNPYDIGIKKYYEGAYSSYISSNSALNPHSKRLEQIHQKVMFNIKQNKFITQLQENKNKFSETDLFVAHKSIRKSEDLEQILRFHKILKSSKYIFSAKRSIFYEHDEFFRKIRKSLHKIESLFVSRLYRKQKRKKYYQRKSSTLRQIIKPIQKFAFFCLLRNCVQAFKEPLFANNQKQRQLQAAIMIQKTYRMYRLRKRYLKIIKKLRQKEDDDEFPEIDLDQFCEMENFQMDLIIPDEFNFDEYIIKPEIFERLQKRQEEKKIAAHQPSKPLVNNFIDGNNQSTVSNGSSVRAPKKQEKPRISQKQEVESIMRNWNISYEAAYAHLMKQRKKQKLKKLQSDKHLNADQRYDRFRKIK